MAATYSQELPLVTTWSNDDYQNGGTTTTTTTATGNWKPPSTIPIHKQPPFPLNDSINQRIALYHGNILRLRADALVHPTNERFERITPLSNALYNQAGQELLKCLYNKLKHCSIGSIKITKGYSTNFHYIIHTASPHYKCKYHTASEQALFNCYFNVLQAAKHYNLRTLVMGTLALQQHDYPELDGIHLGVRILRRFLEQFPDSFDLIILCAENSYQLEIFRSSLRLYFPRNELEEQRQCYTLPISCVGGSLGEPIIPERQIRINENPIRSLHEINDSGLDSSQDDLSFSSSLGNCSSLNGSEINIDECRERLMELNYHEEFDDMDLNSNNHHHFFDQPITGSDGGELSPLSSIGSPRFRSSSFLQTFENILGDHSNPNTPTSHHHPNHPHNLDQYDCSDQLMLHEHLTRLKYERLLRKTKRLEKELSEEVKNALNKAIFIVENNNDSSKNQMESIQTLIIIGYQVAQLFHQEFNGNFDYILAHILRLLEKITKTRDRKQQYVVLYFHTMVDDNDLSVNPQQNMDMVNNQVDTASKTEVLARLYEYLGQQHWKQLKSFYIIHPSISNRLYIWWLKTFYYGKYLKNKVHFINRLEQLNLIFKNHNEFNYKNFIERLPKFILDYEKH